MISPVLFLAAFGFICQTPLPVSAAQAVPDTTRKTLDTMTVTGMAPITSSRVDQKSIEKSLGIIDDLGLLLVQKPGVKEVPESGSLLLVNGEGPLDNLYFIRGIPVFPPADFPGHTFADKSIVSLALPTDISFYTSQLVSQYSGASGSIVTLNPYSLITPDRLPRPEAAIGYSTLTTDLSVNVPFRRALDRYQASFSVPNGYELGGKTYTFGESSNLGYGVPASAWNFRTIGEQNAGSVKIEQLAWVGMNEYAKDIEKTIQFQQRSVTIPTRDRYPWAIVAFSAQDSLAKIPWAISVGGSQQYYLSAQRLGLYTPVKRVQRDNAAVNIQGTLYSDHVSSVNAGLLAEHLQSDATLDLQDTGGSIQVFHRNSVNNNAQFRIGYSRVVEKLRLEINSIQGFYWGGKALFVDPGFSLAFPALFGEGLFSAEINSAPADIRMLPGSEFDDFLARTYHANLAMRWTVLRFINIQAETFAKWKDKAVLPDSLPVLPLPDRGRNASMSAFGGAMQVKIKAGKRCTLTSSLSVSKSTVIEGESRYVSDWDCPWANRTALAFSIIPDKMFVYCIGNFSAGLPYRELMTRGADATLVWSRGRSRLDTYKCVDLKWEWRQPTDGNLVTEYDGFVYLQNIFNNVNVREYQWGNGYKFPVGLQPLTINLGVRLNFRFLYW
jgi:hypothetical protein